jgi:hypothetical protein
VSSPFGLKYFLGLSPYFQVIGRALSFLEILPEGLGLVINYKCGGPGLWA